MGKPISPTLISVRILVADDAEPWRRFICSTLIKHKRLHLVASVADGLEAVTKARELRPDLILLDVGLPTLHGIAAAQWIREVAPRSKIIFLTQNTDLGVTRAALNTGARGYVLKMDAGNELLPAIKAVLKGEKFVSTRVKDYATEPSVS